MRAFLLGLSCWVLVACGAKLADSIEDGSTEVGQDSSALVDAGPVAADAGEVPDAGEPLDDVDAGFPTDVDAGVLGAPTALKAITGGTSVALRWTRGAGAVVSHQILRDGVVVGSVTPGWHADFPEKHGNGFIDPNVVPGLSYSYRVRAVGTSGQLSPESAALTVTHPVNTTPVPFITTDASQAQDLESWLVNTAKPFLEIWYPKIGDRLARPGYDPPPSFTIRIDPAYTGVAYASGTNIVVSANYARGHLQDLGMFLHESTHVLQTYGGNVPGWTTEGVADWTREYLLHDRDPVTPGIGDYFESGYSEGSYFLNWIQERYDSTFIRRLNVASHEGKYSDSLFSERTGKTVNQLWSEMTGSPVPGLVAMPLLAGKCLDNGSVGGNGSAAVVNDCSSQHRQRWGVARRADGTLSLVNGKRCLDVVNMGTAVGTQVQTYPCNGSGAQIWRFRADGSLLNPHSGLCLDVPGSSRTNGTQLQLYSCNATNAQTFTLPY